MQSDLREPGNLLFVSWQIDLDEVPVEQLDHYIAVENFLTDEDKIHPDAENLENLRGYLEAFHHLCEVKDWKKAGELFMTPLQESNKSKLYWLLHLWSYFQEELRISKRLSDRLTPEITAICQNRIGLAYRNLGKPRQAISFHQRAMVIAQEISDHEETSKAL